MKKFRLAPSHPKRLAQFAVGITSALILSACGLEGLDTGVDGQTDGTTIPTIGAATPEQTNTDNTTFTAQIQSDGTLLLDWPSKESAVRYLVVVDGNIVAELPASTSSFVVASNGNLEINTIQILAQDASNTLTPWVNNPTIVLANAQPQTETENPTPAEPTGESEAEEPTPTGGDTPAQAEESTDEEAPTEEEPTDEEAATGEKPADEEAPAEEATADEEAPAEEEPADEEAPAEEEPADEETPAEEEPTDEETPAEEEPTDEETPAEEEPTDEETPTEEEPTDEETPTEEEPTDEETPTEEEPINLAPEITDTSYNCDPIVESVAFTVGDSDFFTLTVQDETLLTLTYAADSSNEDNVSVSVDENGVFTVTALQAGESYLWLTAEDASGLQDEYELHVVVQE